MKYHRCRNLESCCSNIKKNIITCIMHIAVVLSLCFHIAAYGRFLSYSRSFSSQFFSLKNALFKKENLNGTAKLSYFKILNLSGFGIVKGGTRRPNGLLCKLHRNEIRKMHPHTLLIGLEKKIQYICYRNHRILKFAKNVKNKIEKDFNL